MEGESQDSWSCSYFCYSPTVQFGAGHRISFPKATMEISLYPEVLGASCIFNQQAAEEEGFTGQTRGIPLPL